METKSDKNLEIAQRNAKTIAWDIDMLASGHWDMFKRKYKDFWEHAGQISKLFKTLKPILPADREKLWDKFSSICDDVKRKQNAEHESRIFKSKQHYNEIIRQIGRARVSTLFGFSPPDIETMKALGQELREAGNMLSNHKTEMIGEHKQECFEEIRKMREIHDAWWEGLKKQKANKHEDFILRVRANIDRNYERHRKATHALESCRRSADDLREKIATAYNDDWRDKAYVWLSELEDKIRDIESSIERIEEWIKDDEDKLR